MNQLRKEIKPQSFFYRCICLCLSVIFSMTIVSAQNGEVPSSYVIPGWYGTPNYSEKIIQGFNEPVTCADFSNGLSYAELGLYIEGDGQETYNLGLPEFGVQYHGVSDIAPTRELMQNRIPPRPLKPDETVEYPEFEIEDGVLLHYHGSGNHVVIPETVKKINDFAFYNQKIIIEVTIPDGVTSIGDFAFANCRNLSSISLPKGLTYIGDYAFASCGSLSSIKLPEGLKSIGCYAFSSCVNLSNILFPNGLEIIGSRAFINCSNLQSVTIPSGSIGWWAFNNCSHLSSAVILNNVYEIRDLAFSDCARLNSIQVEWKQPLRTWEIIDYESTAYQGKKLIVPTGTKSLYQENSEWGRFQFIEEGNLPTGIASIEASAAVYYSDNRLVVNSPVAETIRVYSMDGSLLYSVVKQEGAKSIHTAFINKGQVLIVRGSSGWVRKTVNYK